jgi:hypothetical protein
MWLNKDRKVNSVVFGAESVRKADCVVICQPFHRDSRVYTDLFVEANAIVDCCNVYPKEVEYYHPDEESKRKVFSL